MRIEADTTTKEVFVRFDDGSTIDVRLWSPEGDTGYLKDGETVEFDDWCTATRMGAYVMWIDPNVLPSLRRRRLERQAPRRTKH